MGRAMSAEAPTISTALRVSEFRTVVEDLRAFMWQVDISSRRFTWVSRHAEELLGYPVERWLNEPCFWENHIHPEDREPVLRFCRCAEALGEDHEFDYRAITADGRALWLRQVVRAVKNEAGKVYEWRGVIIDITDRKHAEAVLQASEERFRKVFEEGPMAMAIVGTDLLIKQANHALCAMLGYTRQELEQHSFSEFTHPDDVARCDEQLRSILFGHRPNYRIEKRYVRKTGEQIWADVFGTTVRDAAGNPLYGVGIAIDITERKLAEQTLRDLPAQLLRLQDDERRRIARDLHDSSGQNLAALKLNLARLERAPLPPEWKSLVSDSLGMAETTLTELRTISHLLHPPCLMNSASPLRFGRMLPASASVAAFRFVLRFPKIWAGLLRNWKPLFFASCRRA